MKPQTISDLNDRFVGELDIRDGWTVLQGEELRGDCDDYALTAALIVARWSWLRFWINVLTLKTTFHHVRALTDGSSHLVLRHAGLGYIDNLSPVWKPRIVHRRRFPWITLPPIVALKILAGKLRD